MVAILTLNVNGMRDPVKRRQVFQLCRDYDISCLQECHISTNTDLASWRAEWGGRMFASFGTSSSCGSLILLPAGSPLEFSDPSTDSDGRIVSITLRGPGGGGGVRLCTIYAPSNPRSRRLFFAELAPHLTGSLPVILTGDFNCVLDTDLDRRGSDTTSCGVGAKELGDLLSDLSLRDCWRSLNPSARSFTWRNAANTVSSRLDRIYVSSSVAVASCLHSPCYFSDHDCVVLNFSFPERAGGGGGFWKCNVSVLADAGFQREFRKAYAGWRTLKEGYDNELLWWEDVKSRIKHFIISFSCRLAKKKRQRRESLLASLRDVVSALNSGRSDQDTLSRYDTLKGELQDLDDIEAEGARIRSRVRDLEEGEKPSKFFFQLEAAQARKKLISSVRSPNGDIVTSTEGISNVYREFYLDLFTEEPVEAASQPPFLDSLSRVLDEDSRVDLDSPLELPELDAALCSMANGKTPGGDGLPKEFYVKFWDLVGPDLLGVFRCAFNLKQLGDSQRLGIITLLEKSGDQLDPKNKRPISLLNVDYKILAKALCIRLSQVLPDIVGQFQTCGVKGRSIHDNVRLLRDLVEYVEGKNLDCLVISLDQQKAFDRVNWDFLFKVLDRLGFGPNFRHWIELLYTDISSAVLINGVISDPFLVTRGVRQGCPLSPLLYVLFIEPFAQTVIGDSRVTGLTMPGANGLQCRVLQYADDTTCIVRDFKSLRRLFGIIEAFERASGSRLNMAKSKGLVFGSWPDCLPEVVPIQWTTDPIKINGVWVGKGDMGRKNWKERLPKLRSSVDKWKGRTLSLLGKVLLVNTLILAPLFFLAPVFPLPSDVERAINRAIFSFIWSGKTELVRRAVLVQSLAKGGLGVVNIRHKCDAFFVSGVKALLGEEGPPWRFFSLYWVASSLRGVLPSTVWRNDIPHSFPPTAYYRYFCKLVLLISQISPDIDWGPVSVRQLYEQLAGQEPGRSPSVDVPCLDQMFKLCHESNLGHRLRDLNWRVIWGALKTSQRLSHWGIGDGKCPRVGCAAPESLQHVFWDCPFLCLLWAWVEHLGCKIQARYFSLTRSCVLYGSGLDTSRESLLIWYLISTVKWLVWCSRCEAMFDGSRPGADRVLFRVKAEVRARIRADFARLDRAKFTKAWCVRGAICDVSGDRLVLRF